MLLMVGGYSFVHPRRVSAALTFIRSVQEFRILEGSKRKVFSIQGSFGLEKGSFLETSQPVLEQSTPQQGMGNRPVTHPSPKLTAHSLPA